MIQAITAYDIAKRFKTEAVYKQIEKHAKTGLFSLLVAEYSLDPHALEELARDGYKVEPHPYVEIYSDYHMAGKGYKISWEFNENQKV